MEQLFNDVRTIAHRHYANWYGNGLDKNDIESEALDWAWPKLERFQELQKESQNGYEKYLKIGLTRLLNRWCQEQLVRQVSLYSFYEDYDNSENTAHTGRHVITYAAVKTGLKGGDERYYKLAEESCTDKQLICIRGVYYNGLGLKHGDAVALVAAEGKLSRQTVYSHIDRAIHNIVSRACKY